ncbi:chaperone SurA precursor [bacterium BMS3Abin14]|nr:chaperone SurA precursor [bacterium BMS3Abin14]
MFRKSLLAGAAILLLFSLPANAGDRVVARVGQRAITSRDVRYFQKENQDLPFPKALQALVKQRLILAWAADNGVRINDNELKNIITSIRKNNSLTEDQFAIALSREGTTRTTFMERVRDEVTASRAMSLAVSRRLKVDEADIREMYRKKYHETSSVTVRHILFSVKKNASDLEIKNAREKAVKLLARIRNGKPFEEAAVEFSEDAVTAAKGGYLGTFSEGELLPELEKVISQMAPGEIAGPVRTAAGFHLVQLIKRETVQPPAFDDVRKDLVEKWKKGRREPELKKWLGELREKYYVEIFPDDKQL